MTRQIPKNPSSISPELANRLSNLRQRLVGFSVVDSQDEMVGTVQDLVVNEQQQLNLVVAAAHAAQAQQHLLVSSKLIQRVYPRSRRISLLVNASTATAITATPAGADAIGAITIEQNDQVATIDTLLENQPIPDQARFPEVVQEETIRLLEERLKVDYQKRKVGEVIVRKEIEIEMIQVPVRREKLIVEQISPDHRQIAEIDLGQDDLSGLELIDSTPNSLTVTGNFSSPKTVAWLFDAIARQPHHGCKRIRINVELDDLTHADLYRSWFDQSSFEQASNNGAIES